MEIKKIYTNLTINKKIQKIKKSDDSKTPDVTLIIGNDFVF